MKKTLTRLSLLLLCGVITFSSCSNEVANQQVFTKKTFGGCVQKGPYINGSSVTITQLDEHLDQMGVVYTTRISDNLGSFGNRDLEFSSPYVELKADGFYFNEVEGVISNAQLPLYALADVSHSNSVNINILTHLESPRIKYLVKSGGLSFAKAKQQAEEEVLNIFGFSLPENESSENLNISNHAILLSVSTILQGQLKTGELSELLADISEDIEKDGKLDDSTLGTQLINNIAFIRADKVLANLVKKYTNQGSSFAVTVQELEKYLQDFKDNCGFKQTLFITYPEKGKYGVNLLAKEVIKIKPNKPYSVKADVPAGASLTVKIKVPSATIPWGGFYVGSNENWDATYDPKTGTNTLTAKKNGESNDLKIEVNARITIEYYENGDTVPTWIKKI